MAYLGYKNKAFMEYKREQERVKIWKIKQKAEQARKRKMLRKWKNLSTSIILQLVVVALIIVFYGVFASALITNAKADTIKVGDGAFVMAVSYTESYDDLQYVANFPNCDIALNYYNQNCTSANIMMCQLEDKLYMPITHNPENTFSSFDFEVDDSQSCGFVKTQAGYSTFVENE
jgi:hypothetical protein